MTQQEIVKEFSNYTVIEQAALINRLVQVMQRKLERKNGDEQAERIAAIDRLYGIAAVEGKPAPTDEEIKEDYVNYLMEKYS
jgi:uncharacterized membrane protein